MAEAQRWISSREFAEWQAFDRISPIGDIRSDWQAALIASTVARVFGSKGKHRIDDFLLRFGPRELPDPEDLGRRVMAMFKRIRRKARGENGDNDRQTGS